MNYGEAATILESIRERTTDKPERDALALAVTHFREREAFWRQQKENADKGGHTPGSDF